MPRELGNGSAREATQATGQRDENDKANQLYRPNG